ncbi:MAG: Acetophenone carboxylase gamma subunit [Pelotomaculum sp. PtaU1.Bin035]|nr:MAG: Acetophenone carboxylase gamma subunit [Pelotomaculum sp. PtaU1.Bin035]
MTTGIAASVGLDPLFAGVYLICGQKIILHKTGLQQYNAATAVLRGLERAGRGAGFQNLQELLISIPVIRLCTSVAQTGLLLRMGQPIGLLVSYDLVDMGRRVLAALGLPRDMVVDIPAQNTADKLKFAINRLLNCGVRCIGVCLAGSWRDPKDEHQIRMLINNQYPPHYLGSVPIMLSSDYKTGLNDEERIIALAIDCYMSKMVQNHFDEIRTALEHEGFSGVLLIAEGNGGLSPVSHVCPSKAVMAAQAAFFAVAKYWIKRVAAQGVALKIGSLNSEITVIDGGAKADSRFLSLLHENIVGGIASILTRRGDRFVLTAPDNFTDLGGSGLNWRERAPTLLDAMLVLGYLNSDSLGRTGPALDRSAARDAMARLTGHGAGEIEAAALRACHDVADNIASMIRLQVKRRGINAAASAFLVCGEAGGVLACAVAERLGWNVIYTIPGSSMTLAIGAMMLEIRQYFRYCLRDGMNIKKPSVLHYIIDQLERQSGRFLKLTNLDNLSINKEFGIEYTAQGGGEDQYLYRKFKEHRSLKNKASAGGLYKINGYRPSAFTLKLTGTLPKAPGALGDIRKQIYEMVPANEQRRQVYLGPSFGWHDCLVYRLPGLEEGEVLPGPVLVEAVDSVYWVPSGWRYVAGAKGADRIEREVAV